MAASAQASTACCCFVIVAVFAAGLMVGRTPEYLGKKIEAKEVKDGHAPPSSSCLYRCWPSQLSPWCSRSGSRAWRHAWSAGYFSEALYLYTSQTANNGSAFAGMTGNTLW